MDSAFSVKIQRKYKNFLQSDQSLQAQTISLSYHKTEDYSVGAIMDSVKSQQ
jgi:hypothetical protein